MQTRHWVGFSLQEGESLGGSMRLAGRGLAPIRDSEARTARSHTRISINRRDSHSQVLEELMRLPGRTCRGNSGGLG